METTLLDILKSEIENCKDDIVRCDTISELGITLVKHQKIKILEVLERILNEYESKVIS
jgi:hypothetical protein